MINKFDKLSRKPIHKFDDLSVETVPHGFICPLVCGASGQNERCMYGGVVDESFKFVKSSLQKREQGEFSINIEDWYIGAEPDISGKNIKYIDEDVVFIGPIKHHFAHFYLESLSRLWFLLDNTNKKYKIAYLTQDNDEPDWKNFNAFFELLGISKENLLEIKEYTQFRNVIIPEQSFVLNGYYHNLYLRTIDRIMLNVKPARYKKVFFSKKYNYYKGNRTIGDDISEELFKKNGYKIFYPEKLDVYKMLSILKGCETFAAQSASNAHNALFCSNNVNLIILNRSPHVHIIQNMINEMRHLNTTYIDAYYPILPVDMSIGPFSFYFSKYVKQFCVDNHMKYNERVLKKKSKKNVMTYLKTWAEYYSNAQWFKHVENEDISLKLLIENISDIDL